MPYEAEAGDLNLIAVGDTIVNQKLSVYREERYLALVELIRGADAAFSNLEMTFHNYEVAPSVPSVPMGPTYAVSDPRNLNEYKWIGFNLVTMAHNHHNDYGIDGLLTSQRHIEAAGLVHAGTGHNLAEARVPGYLETPRGRVALLACTSTFVEAGTASHQRPDHLGRPGISPLRYRHIYTLDPPAFEQVRRMSEGLGLEAMKKALRSWVAQGSVPHDTDTEFHFMDRGFPPNTTVFRLGQEFGISSVPDEKDMADILKWVREARRQADWVLMSIHCHETDVGPEVPPAFLEAFARACVDDGVDVFIGHGPHFTRGIEIYKGKPIFYGLGNFVFQNETYRYAPQETYEVLGLGYEHTPADAWDARTAKGTASVYSDPKYWHGLVAQPIFKGWKLEEVRLHITDQGYGQPRSRNGRPVLAGEGLARTAVERVARLSQPYNVEVAFNGGVGIIRP